MSRNERRRKGELGEEEMVTSIRNSRVEREVREGGERRVLLMQQGGAGDVEGSTATAAAGAVATGGRHGDNDRAFGRYRTMTFF